MYTPYMRVRSLAYIRGLALTLVLVLGLVALLAMRSLVIPTTVPAPSISSDLIKLPLSFVPNAGQAEAAVHFEVHDMGGTIFFTSGETVLALPATTQASSSVVRLHFEGANPASTMVGVNRLPGIVNYFIGDDPALWRTNIPTYAGIVYQQLYPGIDLSYEGTKGQLKSTYVVAPGADPTFICWRHNGATSVRVDEATGNLLIALAGSTLIEHTPLAWQEVNGQHVSVAARYVLTNDGRVSFGLGSYDSAKPLIIDPTLSYSTYLGGSSIEDAEGIALDGDGNIYVTGTTNSGDFPTADALDDSYNGEDDVYVAKINAAGDTLLYSTYIGDSEDDEGNDIAVDGDGNAYVTGVTDSANFPTQNPLQARGGMDDAFVVKLNADGNALVYSTYLGGSGIEEGEGIAVDGDGNAYVVGTTFSSGWLTGAYGGNGDVFVVKVNASGSALVYGTYLSGSSTDSGAGIAVDSAGNAYVTGETTSINFPTQNPFQLALAGSSDVFVAKLNASGSALLYSTYLGGGGSDYSYGVAIDNADHAYVTGNTESSDFPTQAPLYLNAGSSDVFVTKLNANGNALLYSTYLSGSGDDKGYGIAVDTAGDAYVTGDTYSADFPVYGSLQAYGGNSDAFVVKLKADGALLYSTYLGGGASDYGTDVAVGSAGNVLVAGITFSDDFPTQDPLYGSYSDNGDVFVAKINDVPLPTSETPTPAPPLSPNLVGSYKSASQYVVTSGETLTYTIHLRNSGTIMATVVVTDQLPAEVDYVVGSADPAATYGAGTLFWSGVSVPAGSEVPLTFRVTAKTFDTPTPAVNEVIIVSDSDSFERKVVVVVIPESMGGDPIPPIVHSLTIDEQDVLTDPAVTLHISATDNVGVNQMYLQEWQLVTRFVPHWEVVQSSGWVSYQENYAWTLVSGSGTHFVGVWVADAAGNVSHLNRRGLDYASLLLPGETVGKNGLVPYLVHYEALENVSAVLTPTTGDADLYVWYTGDPSEPIAKSTNSGTLPDEVSFQTEHAGSYLFLVFGYTAATYDLSITPAGGPRAWSMAGVHLSGTNQVMAPKPGELIVEPVLSQSGPDPLSQATPPGGPPFKIYIPVIFK